jgi:hypothetical protein
MGQTGCRGLGCGGMSDPSAPASQGTGYPTGIDPVAVGAPNVNIDEVHDRLAAGDPDQGSATVVHGDYRLDNCIASAHGEMVAALDWELCTPCDPLADLGQLLVYWPAPGKYTSLGQAPTLVPGFPSRGELQERYAGSTRARPGPTRFLPGVRLLEAGLHSEGRARPLCRRCHRRRWLRLQRLPRFHRLAGKTSPACCGQQTVRGV